MSHPRATHAATHAIAKFLFNFPRNVRFFYEFLKNLSILSHFSITDDLKPFGAGVHLSLSYLSVFAKW